MIFSNVVEKLYRQRIYTRHDESPLTFYFRAEDFPGLRAEEFSFTGHKGQNLKGFFYSYPDADGKTDRIVVFDHGMGSGHRAYLREIERMAKEGYTVFAYDHTGTGDSEGDNINGFAQSLNDLDHCLTALKQTEVCKGKRFSVIGHSWGGFSTLNITALHPDVTHTVAMSGFLSVKRIVDQSFTGLLRPYRKMAHDIEKRANPKYEKYDGLESLKQSNAKTLVIYSKDDPVVRYKFHFAPVKELFANGDGRVTVLDTYGNKHSPNYTLDAVRYKDEYFEDLNRRMKDRSLNVDNSDTFEFCPKKAEAYRNSFDWWRMTAQDEEVWEEIFRHLEK